MIKKLTCLLLALGILSINICASAATEASNIDGYTVISGEGKIKDFSNATKSPFTEDSTNIGYVSMLTGVSSVGNNAFKNCTNLRDVVLPSSLRTIGSQAFAGCNALTKVVIPYGVTYIMNYAFIDCTSLHEVYIPDTVTMIGESAFYGCDNLTIYAGENSCARAYGETDNINFKAVDGVQNNIIDVLDTVKVIINGTELSYKYPIVMKNSMTLIPLRSIFEAVGCTVAWDDTTKTAYAEKNGITLGLRTETSSIYVNGEERMLSTPTTLMCDNTMVHVRAVEYLGMDVTWDDASKTITITY